MKPMEVIGYVTEKGKLKLDLPEQLDLPVGRVRVLIMPVPVTETGEERAWTKEELERLVEFTGPEPEMAARPIITDTAALVEDVQRKEWEWKRMQDE